MPELPEVEHGRRLAEGIARGRRIAEVSCADDRIVFEGPRPAAFRRALLGREVLDVRRRGKHVWFVLDRPPHPLFHFGMAGGFAAPARDPLRLASSGRKRDGSWPPRFTKIRFVFDDGGELAMTDKRRLGRIRLREDPLHEPPISALGYDPLLDPFRARDFASRLRERSSVVKAVLLDQSFAAGVGNWIADEVLFQAAIDPRRRASALSAEDAERIGRVLRRVVRRAVAVDADSDRFPSAWLFHRRWGRPGDARTSGGHRIRFLDVAGRTTAFVPAIQR